MLLFDNPKCYTDLFANTKPETALIDSGFTPILFHSHVTF